MNPVNRKRFQKHVSRLYTQMSSMCGSSEGVHRPDWPHRAAPAPPSGHIDSLTDWLTVNWSQPRAVNCCSSPAGQWRHVDSIMAAVTADNCWVSVSTNRLPAVETPDTRRLSLLTSASLNLLLQTHHCVCISVIQKVFIYYISTCVPTHTTCGNSYKQKGKQEEKKYFYWGICLPVVTMTTPNCQWCRWWRVQSSGWQLQGNILS